MTLDMLFRVLSDRQKVSLQFSNDEKIFWVGIAHNIPIEYFDKLVVNVIALPISISETEIRIIVK